MGQRFAAEVCEKLPGHGCSLCTLVAALSILERILFRFDFGAFTESYHVALVSVKKKSKRIGQQYRTLNMKTYACCCARNSSVNAQNFMFRTKVADRIEFYTECNFFTLKIRAVFEIIEARLVNAWIS